MKKIRIVLSTLILAIAGDFTSPAMAQSPAEEQPEVNAVERIVIEGEGNVEIEIPDDILEKILTDQDSGKKKDTKQNLRPGINKLSGYRIQVFSDGRNHHTLESRARMRGSAIASKFPKYRYQVYTYSSAPNWYTRIGNFRTQGEAAAALRELKAAFPAFAPEMRVVRSQIVIIK